jgi:hypothetical protein
LRPCDRPIIWALPAVYKRHSSRLTLRGNRSEVLIREAKE